LLRWLDRFAAAPASPRQAPAEGPKLRKRDVHPDAPAVRPISAIQEFGEPASPLAVKRKPVVAAEPAPVVADGPAVEPAVEPILSVATLRQLAVEEEPEPVARPEPAARPESVEPIRPPSLSELMARLEKGLAERRTGPSAADESAAPAPRPAPQVFPEAGDDRLQSAIESLQRLAARDR
jgi:hypothetical protein